MNKILVFSISLLVLGLISGSAQQVSAVPTTPPTHHVVIVDRIANPETGGGIFILQGSSLISDPQITPLEISGNPVVTLPQDVAIDNLGNIIIASFDFNTFSPVIDRVTNPLGSSKTKTLVSTGSDLPAGSFIFVEGVTVDSSGNIYVVDSGLLKVIKIDNTNAATELSPPTSDFLLNPIDITIDKSGTQERLLVLDRGDGDDDEGSSGRIISINPSSGAQTLIYDGGFSDPKSIAVSLTGHILVTDAGDDKIYRIVNLTTKTSVFSNSLTNLFGLVIDPLSGDIWFSDSADPQVVGYDYPGFAGDKTFQSTLISGPERIDILHGTTPPSEIAAVTLLKTGPATIDFIPNGEFTYTLTATNNGPASTNVMTIQDTLPNNLELVSSETRINGILVTNPNTTPKQLCLEVSGLVTCNGFGTINPTNTVEIKMKVRFIGPVSGLITNQATVTSQNSQASASFPTTVTNLAGDIGIVSVTGPGPITQGSPTTYVITVENKPGFAAATNVQVLFTSNGIQVNSVSSSGDSSLSCTALPCNLGTILNAKQAKVTISATILPGTPIAIQNTATVSSNLNDLNLADNTKLITTTVIRPPIITPAGPFTIPEQQLFSFTFIATDPNTPPQPITFSLSGSPPTGASITSAGVFTWTPTEAQGPGSYNFNVVATKGSQSTILPVTINVNEVNKAPILAAIPPQNVNELNTLTFTATATDPDLPANTLTFSLSGSPPTGASITSAGVFTWTPTEAQGPGSYNFNVVVTDNGSPPLSDTKQVTINVNEVNLKPTITQILDQTMSQGQTLTIPITSSDPDLPLNTLVLSGTFPASFSTLVDNGDGTGSITFTPLASDVGVYPITIKVTDNGTPALSDSTSFQLTVLANSPPIAVNDFYDVNANDILTILPPGVLANDSDPDFDTLTASLQSNTSFGTVVLNTNGGFTFSPSQVVFGSDSFTYVANDGTINSNLAKVTLTQKFCGKTIGQFDEIIVGTPGKDKLKGTHGNDLIIGLGGDDKINGLKGDDCIIGGDGDDKINGNQGNDTIIGGNGDDKLNGNYGNDKIIGGEGKDDIKGNNGNDELFGDGGNDKIYGGNGDDFIDGGANTDKCKGGKGNNTINNCEDTKEDKDKDDKDKEDCDCEKPSIFTVGYSGPNDVSVEIYSKENYVGDDDKILAELDVEDGKITIHSEDDLDKDKLESNTVYRIIDSDGDTIDIVSIHTSCSQPLYEGQQFTGTGGVTLTVISGTDLDANSTIPEDQCKSKDDKDNKSKDDKDNKSKDDKDNKSKDDKDNKSKDDKDNKSKDDKDNKSKDDKDNKSSGKSNKK